MDEYVITKQGIEAAAAEAIVEVIGLQYTSPYKQVVDSVAEIILSHCKVRPSSLESSGTK